ncbi:MAG: hypothetical protein JST22_21655 [Bacteroidetes bacterium]|nr:hypothetical protein [Bacteroidota bacterium]
MLRIRRQPDAARDGDTPRDARVREQLDGLVVNMELTLISIIQGVALYFLVESSRGMIIGGEFERWPYIVVALITIFLFWSRSLLHTFTVIGWPLEFGHNFIYIACTLVEAVMFTQLANLRSWYAVGIAYGLMVWFLFLFDLEMIHRLRRNSSEEAAVLCDLLERDQRLNLRVLVPGLVAFNVLAWLAIRLWPSVLLDQGWHVVIGCMQLIGGALYLRYVLRFFRRIAPMIVQWRR